MDSEQCVYIYIMKCVHANMCKSRVDDRRKTEDRERVFHDDKPTIKNTFYGARESHGAVTDVFGLSENASRANVGFRTSTICTRLRYRHGCVLSLRALRKFCPKRRAECHTRTLDIVN